MAIRKAAIRRWAVGQTFHLVVRGVTGMSAGGFLILFRRIKRLMYRPLSS